MEVSSLRTAVADAFRSRWKCGAICLALATNILPLLFRGLYLNAVTSDVNSVPLHLPGQSTRRGKHSIRYSYSSYLSRQIHDKLLSRNFLLSQEI
jgi:hypothetical protein